MTKRTTRQVLAVMAVTTALCADRAMQAAPLTRTPVAERAGRLVMRLARRLRRGIVAVVPWQKRQRGTVQARRPILAPPAVFVAFRSIMPFQFRLPPPVC